MPDLLEKILNSGYVDLYQREKDGSWGLVIDAHLDITGEDAEVVHEILGTRGYTVIGVDGQRSYVSGGADAA